jgi:hypothetical protein
MASEDRIVNAVVQGASAYNQTLLVTTGATATVSPGPARLAAIYALSSTTGTTSVQGFFAENGSALAITIASAVSGPVFAPAVPCYVASIAVNTNTAADTRKFLFVWKSAS